MLDFINAWSIIPNKRQKRLSFTQKIVLFTKKGVQAMKKLPKVITRDEFQQIIGSINPKTRTGKRQRAILWLLFNCGLRRQELCSLQVGDLDMNARRIHLKHGTKNGKDRILYFNPETQTCLDSWFEVRGDIQTDVPEVFITNTGKPLHPVFLNKMIGRVGKKAGFNRRIHPHLFRHSALTEIYELSGNNILLTQQVAGHSDVTTTQIYAHISASAIRETMKEF